MKYSYRAVLFVLIVAVPLGLFTFYETHIASDRFHSAAAISITEDKKSIPTLDLTSFGLPGASDNSDAMTLVTFMTSPDMMDYLDKRLGLRQHFSDAGIDWWSRLPARAHKEEFYEYMAWLLTIQYDQVSHLVKVEAQAFSREYARAIVTALIERSQEFVDRLNEKITAEKIKFLENQLSAAEERLRKAKADMLEFQRKNGLLTADAEASMVNASIAALKSELMSKQAQLDVSLQELDPQSPTIKWRKAEIETLKNQLKKERDHLSVGSTGSSVSALAAQFAEIQAEVTFLENVYKSNLTQLEAAKVEASQRLKYLLIVTSPSLADASLFPARTYNIVTAAILLLMCFFVLSLIVAIVREHM